MAIKKSLRKGNSRYVAFKQIYENKPKSDKEIMESIRKYCGLLEMPPIKIIYLSGDYGIIKTNNDGLKKVILSLILSSDNESRMEVMDSSGTIKSIRERNKEFENFKKN